MHGLGDTKINGSMQCLRECTRYHEVFAIMSPSFPLPFPPVNVSRASLLVGTYRAFSRPSTRNSLLNDLTTSLP